MSKVNNAKVQKVIRTLDTHITNINDIHHEGVFIPPAKVNEFVKSIFPSLDWENQSIYTVLDGMRVEDVFYELIESYAMDANTNPSGLVVYFKSEYAENTPSPPDGISWIFLFQYWKYDENYECVLLQDPEIGLTNEKPATLSELEDKANRNHTHNLSDIQGVSTVEATVTYDDDSTETLNLLIVPQNGG